jgi:hypothetical protein
VNGTDQSLIWKGDDVHSSPKIKSLKNVTRPLNDFKDLKGLAKIREPLIS